MPARPPIPRPICRWLSMAAGALLIGPAWADALSDGRFRDEVAAVVREMRPGAAIPADPDPAQIQVDHLTFGLTNLYPRVAPLVGEERRRAIEAFLAPSLKRAPGGSTPVAVTREQGFTAAKSRLRVQLVPREIIQQAPYLVSRPFSDTLHVVYVLDEAQRYQYVTRDMLAGWGVEAAAVEPIAVANLAAASKDAAFNVALADGKPAIAMATAGDDYDAARLMLPRYLESIREALKADVVIVAAPNRNLLMAWPAGSPARKALAAEVRKQMRTGPYGRSDELFRFDRDGLRPMNALERAEQGR